MVRERERMEPTQDLETHGEPRESTVPAGSASPVGQLLSLGEAELHKWPDYLALGIGPEDIPDLVRMLQGTELQEGDADGTEIWAPLHAWRALGQLRAVEVVEPLLDLLLRWGDDDWVNNEAPRVFNMVGRAAIPSLARFILVDEYDTYARAVAAEGLEEIGRADPTARGESVEALTAALTGFAEQDPLFNGFLIGNLVELRAVEAAPLIEIAFAADAVEISIPGDWEDVQIGLGLLDERITPRPNYHTWPGSSDAWEAGVNPDNELRKAEAKARKKTKARKAIAKRSRKANRRRKR